MKISILGTVGLPARYGGWETLVENLVRFHDANGRTEDLTVYCTATAYPEVAPKMLSANLRYSRLRANGWQSVLYDAVTLFDAVRRGTDVILLLGISGAVALPLVRLFSRARIVTNIDGIEWRRDKWQGIARHFLKWSEKLAIRYSHVVLSDNQGISNYVNATYGRQPITIAYGGDHAISVRASKDGLPAPLPEEFALSVCRIEPENNIETILRACAQSGVDLVLIGNWNSSTYGKEIREKYRSFPNLHLWDPIYNLSTLRYVRGRSWVYLHGHSAGGTNPSLVEIMHFGVPVLAFDCVFNRYTTHNEALYFKDENTLETLLEQLSNTPERSKTIGQAMHVIALKRYTWAEIGAQYFDVMLKAAPDRSGQR
jgi:glycosyltransferase involved in cell wall biosynthesis